jgi:hypothetical protein
VVIDEDDNDVHWTRLNDLNACPSLDPSHNHLAVLLLLQPSHEHDPIAYAMHMHDAPVLHAPFLMTGMTMFMCAHTSVDRWSTHHRSTKHTQHVPY